MKRIRTSSIAVSIALGTLMATPAWSTAAPGPRTDTSSPPYRSAVTFDACTEQRSDVFPPATCSTEMLSVDRKTGRGIGSGSMVSADSGVSDSLALHFHSSRVSDRARVQPGSHSITVTVEGVLSSARIEWSRDLLSPSWAAVTADMCLRDSNGVCVTRAFESLLDNFSEIAPSGSKTAADQPFTLTGTATSETGFPGGRYEIEGSLSGFQQLGACSPDTTECQGGNGLLKASYDGVITSMTVVSS